MLCEQDLCCVACLLPLVMLSIVTHSAVCAVLTCLHVLLLSAAADNWRGLEHQSAHFCNCCDGEVWQPVSHCLQAPVCKPLSASPCLQALVCKLLSASKLCWRCMSGLLSLLAGIDMLVCDSMCNAFGW